MLKCYNHEEHIAIGMCTNCGKAICDSCKMEVQGKLICKKCAEIKLERELKENTTQFVPINQQQVPQQMQMYPMDLTKKNKDVAAMLAIFGGWFGLHKFYLNKPGQGVAMALFSSTGIPLVISLVEAYSYFSSSEERFDRKFNEALFTYKNQLPQPNQTILNPHVIPNPVPEDMEKQRMRSKFRNERIIDLENDLVDEKKKEEERKEKEEIERKNILENNRQEDNNIEDANEFKRKSSEEDKKED